MCVCVCVYVCVFAYMWRGEGGGGIDTVYVKNHVTHILVSVQLLCSNVGILWFRNTAILLAEHVSSLHACLLVK